MSHNRRCHQDGVRGYWLPTRVHGECQRRRVGCSHHSTQNQQRNHNSIHGFISSRANSNELLVLQRKETPFTVKLATLRNLLFINYLTENTMRLCYKEQAADAVIVTSQRIHIYVYNVWQERSGLTLRIHIPISSCDSNVAPFYGSP